MKKFLSSIIILLFTFNAIGQIWIDDFDGSNSNPFSTSTECGGDPNFYHYGVACLSGGGCGLEINPAYNTTYSNIDGNFLAAMNTDSGPCGPADEEFAEWTGIDISGCEKPDKLFLCFKAAAFATNLCGTCGWDSPSHVKFFVTIDGGTQIQVSAIEDQGSDSQPAFDSDCDGDGDSFELDGELTEYCVQIPGYGSSLDLLIEMDGLNEGPTASPPDLEDVIIDDVAIYCEADDSSLSGQYLGCGSTCFPDVDCDGIATSDDCDDNDDCNTFIIPDCAGPCEIEFTVSNIDCNNAGSPSDPSDDTFSFDIFIDGTGTGSTWSTDDPDNNTGSYNNTFTFGPYPISSGDLSFTITDDDDPTCEIIVSVEAPTPCSDECNIMHTVSDIVCDDNGTPTDPSDDTYTFDVFVSGMNVSGAWSADDPDGTSGSYDTNTSFGPYDISDGVLSFTITDDTDSDCTTDVSVTPPGPCSDLCVIDAVASNILCDDNGTPSDPSDDTFEFDLLVTGVNNGASWTADDPLGSSGTYNSSINLSGYPISGGNLNFTVTDFDDPACVINVMVTAPATCSDLCDIDAVASNLLCDDNGTPIDPSDDTYTFDILVSGVNTGVSWSANDPNSTTGAYDSAEGFGPFDISDGTITITIEDVDDPLCTFVIMVDPPGTCSDQCDIDFALANILCNNAGTPSDDTDDTFTFEIVVNGSNIGASWTADDPDNTTGNYNSTVIFGPYDISDGDLNFTISDIDDSGCTVLVFVEAPNTCSTVCSISNTIDNIICDDNGTPSDPSDDTYTFEVFVSGLNVGGGWDGDDANNSSGLYGVTTVLGPYDIADGNLTFNIIDDTDLTCITEVNINPPATCSDLCDINAIASNILCDDNGTPSDPSDDTFSFDVLISGLNTGASWNANDPNNTSGPYDISQPFGPYPIAGGDLNFTISDGNDAGCTFAVSVTAPAPCSDLCDIDAVASNVLCDDNGTPSDPSDDTFSFDLLVTGVNTGTLWSADDPNSSSGSYGSSINLSGYPISAGNLNFTITDGDDPACTVNVTVTAPATCSDLCIISANASNILCDDNGTPSDPSDDTFSFDLFVDGMNIGGSWSATDPNSTNGNYNATTNFGPYPISGGDLSFNLTDDIDASCTEIVMITAPATCSDECDIDFIISNIVCNNAGTPSDDTDDTFTFDIIVTGSNTGLSWTANDPNTTSGNYNATVNFGPYPIAGGNLIFTITDIDDPTCTASINVEAPSTCSTLCSISNSVDNIVCNDNGTPSDPSDDTFTFEVVVSGLNVGSGWNADDPNASSGLYGATTVLGPFNIADGNLTFTITDDTDPNCITLVDINPPATCSDLCDIEAVSSNIICDDNGTPSDPSDDTFTFDLLVTGLNTGSSWTATDPNNTSGSYNISQSFGPYAISAGDLSFTVIDANDAACTFVVSVTTPPTCSDLCDINATASNILCDDNGTPSDPSDDTFSFDLLVNGANTGLSWTANDPNSSTGSYGTTLNLSGYPISAGNLNFTITDSNDPACTFIITVTAPATCSDLCVITANASNIVCDDNGTPSDPSDDTFSFDLFVDGMNIGGSWSATDPNSTSGAYNATTNFGPYPISGGDLSFNIIDGLDPSCTEVVMISAPPTCSDQCEIDFTVSNIVCNNAGTPSDDSDDTYTFDIIVTGSNSGASWNANDPNITSGNYNIAVTFGPYLIATGNQNFTITDINDSGCTASVIVLAPSTCSTLCSISNSVDNILCNDNGTPSDPSDDTFTFEVIISGLNVGGAWSADDPNVSSGLYGVTTILGPYNISDGILNFTITDDTDPNCTTVVSVTPPATCSDLCDIEAVASSIVCNDNGTPSDPTDDTFTFDLLVTGLNTGSSWTATDPNSTTGSYNISLSFGPYPISGGDLNFIVIDANDAACTVAVNITAPATCSDLCDIDAIASSILCDDNGTPSDPSDDTFSFDLFVTGANIGTSWSADDPNGSTGSYNAFINLSGYPINGGDLNFTITDSNDPSCTFNIIVTAPSTCSDLCDITANVFNIQCDDNGTPTDDSDDTFSFDIEVTGLNTGTAWSATDPNASSGNYGVITNLGPYNISGGALTFDVIDSNDASCSDQVTVEPPATCSDECEIEFTISNIMCDNAGTPSDDSDDIFTFDIIVNGSNIGASWTANDPNNTSGPYNTTVNFGPYLISDGNQNFTLTDIDDSGCTAAVIVQAPDACSTSCSISNNITNIECNDNGTPTDPSDDTFTFEVTVSGSNTAAGWTADDPLGITGPYSTTILFGPYNIDNGILNFTITDDDDAGCTTIISVTPPATCSDECEIESTVSFITCDDNGTPSDPTDDTFSFDLEVIGFNTASSWTADDPNGSSGSYNSPVFMGAFLISDGDLTFTVTDGNDPNCTVIVEVIAPDNCSDACSMELEVINVVCDDNGTPTDPSDDLYSFDIIVSGENTATGWNANDINNSNGTYNNLTGFGPFDIAAGSIQFTVFDNDNPNCSALVEVDPPNTCSDLCEIDGTVTNIQCDDNGTPGDSSDDVYTFDLIVNGTNNGTNWSANDPNNTFGAYNTTINFGPYSISGGDLSFVVTDLDDSSCFVLIDVAAPLSCSDECSIEFIVTNVMCQNNGTPTDDTDDLYTFDIVVSGSNTAASWTATDINNMTGAYNSSISFGPFEIANGNQNFMIIDDLDPNCAASVLVQAPTACSTLCSISNTVGNIECDNNGTPSDPSDDTFNFELNITGSNIGSGWTSNDPNNTSGSYNTNTVLGPFNIADGILNFVVTDDSDINCTTIVSVTPPSTCSDLCDLEVTVDNFVCDGNGTSDPDDDTFSFEVLVTGQNIGNTWSADDPNTTSGSYDNVVIMGPYLISNGDFSFTIFDGIDGACLEEIDIIALESCSEGCDTGMTETMACDDGIPCTINDVMLVLVSDGTICEPCAGETLDCNSGPTSVVSCDDGDPNTINDEQTVLDCDTNIICEPCTGTPVACDLMVDQISIDCDDAQTINDTTDDIISVSFIISGGIGNTFSMTASNGNSITNSGSYGTLVNIDFDSGSAGAGNLQITITDDDDSNCSTVIDIQDPGPCSNNIDCDSGDFTIEPCDDGNPCTINDQMVILTADGSICEPCSGEQINCDTGATSIVSCDDGNPNTINDMETVLDCDGSICIPCQGESVECVDVNQLYIPNIISTSTQGPNSIFSLTTACDAVQVIDFKIYNRWGNLVHSVENISSDDPSVNWNGRFNGQAVEPGVYVYMIILDPQNINQTRYQGSITVLR